MALADDIKRASAMQQELVALNARIARESRPAPVTERSLAALADAQARADSVMQGLGSFAPAPMPGEALNDYRRRLAGMLQRYSPSTKGVDFKKIPDDTLAPFETMVYADAAKEAERPTVNLPEEGLRMVTKNMGGREVNEFFGRDTFITGMKRPSPRVTRFRTPDVILLERAMANAAAMTVSGRPFPKRGQA